MRNAVFCAASIALVLVLAEQVVAGAAGPDQVLGVNRALKGDRAAISSHVSPAPAMTIIPKNDDTQEPIARRIPEGCETAVSPLAKSAGHAPAARCLADAGQGRRTTASG
jgi:hypothetical protein